MILAWCFIREKIPSPSSTSRINFALFRAHANFFFFALGTCKRHKLCIAECEAAVFARHRDFAIITENGRVGKMIKDLLALIFLRAGHYFTV